MEPVALGGRRVAILGGTSGIGLATAQAAAALGAEVIVVGSRPARVAKALAELPATATGHTADLTDEAALIATVTALGPIDHLAYTAGEPLVLTPLPDLDTATAAGFFRLRYFGALAAVRAATPHLRDGGSITLITGTAADRPTPGWTVGASLCGAMDALTRALAVELAPRIRVNAVKPGVIRTPLWSALPDDAREALFRDNAASVPLARVGEVGDVARAFIYCMTQPFATGAIIPVDGGALAA
ncbi:SDR family oxidoreductase [Dactylosporangium sp. NPDC000244]|uniref:SDR family oxidoreductase n=1 Tax=Dactylosporangium sp. NPDC000244 TaxID=3154365 RepID=UPI003327FE7D